MTVRYDPEMKFTGKLLETYTPGLVDPTYYARYLFPLIEKMDEMQEIPATNYHYDIQSDCGGKSTRITINNGYVTEVKFVLDLMPFNCGILIIRDIGVDSRYANQLERYILQESERFAYDIGFTVLMYTTLVTEHGIESRNAKWKSLNQTLKELDYKVIDTFVNYRSSNENLIWTKHIR